MNRIRFVKEPCCETCRKRSVANAKILMESFDLLGVTICGESYRLLKKDGSVVRISAKGNKVDGEWLVVE